MTLPNEVHLVYRKVGDYHVFTCAEIPGLYVGHDELERAFDRAVHGLSVHATAVFSQHVRYAAQISCHQFAELLNDAKELRAPFLSMYLDENCKAAA